MSERIHHRVSKKSKCLCIFSLTLPRTPTIVSHSFLSFANHFLLFFLCNTLSRSSYPHEFDWYSNSGGEKRPYTVARWPRSPDALNVYSTKTSEEPFRIWSPRGREVGTRRSRSSSLSSKRSRRPVHFSPRVQLSAGRNASSSSSPSPRGGGKSLFAKEDESVITSESAATSLRKLSSFWLVSKRTVCFRRGFRFVCIVRP